jgi:hypothetical protein
MNMVSADMLQVIEAMGAFTLAINYYQQGRTGCLTIGELIQIRTGVEKSLLLLPTAEELNIPPASNGSSPDVYECCRLATMIFGIAVVFQIPKSFGVLQKYVTLPRAGIED